MRFYHYVGGTWTRAGDVSNASLFDLAMTSADEGWASGGEGIDSSVLFHYEGGVWSPVALPTHTRVYEVTAAGAGEVWAVGATDIPNGGGWQRGVVLHYRDGNWTSATIPKKPALDTGDAIRIGRRGPSA
jgi:hypothetical protein